MGVRRTRVRFVGKRLVAGTVAVAVLALGTSAILPAVSSGASGTVTLTQAQHEVAALNVEADIASQRYDLAQQRLVAARARVTRADEQAAAAARALLAGRRRVDALAVSTYTSGGFGEQYLNLLTTANPQTFFTEQATLGILARDNAAVLLDMAYAQHRLAEARLTALQAERSAARSVRDLATVRRRILALLARRRAILAQLTSAQLAVVAPPPAAAPALPALPANSPAFVREVLALAYAQIGKPYVWGGAGPNDFDCSGLTMWVFAHFGIYLPHYAQSQYDYGTRVPLADLQPADLVFFADSTGYIYHVGIYIGDGEMIDAPHTGTDVQIDPVFAGAIGGVQL